MDTLVEILSAIGAFSGRMKDLENRIKK